MKIFRVEKKFIVQMMIVSLLYSVLFTTSAFAAGSRFLVNVWVDENKGPGVARWVEEDEVTDTEGQSDATEENASLPQADEEEKQEEDQQENSQAEEGTETASAEQETGQVERDEQIQTGGRVIDPSKPMVALTFDDGPNASVDNQIMDCLTQYGGKATFYVVGNRCAMYPEAMRRMAAEGHEIGNHTYEHKVLTRLNASQIRYQIDRGREAIIATAGVAPATVRLPGGGKNATVLATVKEPILMWSIDTLDWKTKDTNATVRSVLDNVKDGDIVLMHDLYSQTGAAATQIIPALVQRGYQLVTVSELAQYRGGLSAGGVYSRFRP